MKKRRGAAWVIAAHRTDNKNIATDGIRMKCEGDEMVTCGMGVMPRA
jgi:hypothetical protein